MKFKVGDRVRNISGAYGVVMVAHPRLKFYYVWYDGEEILHENKEKILTWVPGAAGSTWYEESRK